MPEKGRRRTGPRRDPPFGADPTDGGVSIYGTPKPIKPGTILVGVIDVIALVGLLLGLATGTMLAIILGTVTVIMIGIPSAVIAYAARLPVGKPQMTASSQGLWTRYLQFRWDEIQACEFVTAPYAYVLATDPSGPQLVRTSNLLHQSLIVTLKAADAHGRPLQYGSTLWQYHTANFDEFWSAIRQFAPHVGHWSVLGTAQYVVVPAFQDAIAAEISATGMVSVRDRRGNSRFGFDPQGVILKNGTRMDWPNLVAIDAYTMGNPSQKGYFLRTAHTNILWFVTPESRERNWARPRERPNLRSDYTPPIEQLMPTILRWAPHLEYTDSRKIRGAT